MKMMIRLLQLALLYIACFGANQAKFVGNVKDGDDGGTVTILDIQDDNKTQYLNQNFEQGNYNYGYDIKPSGPVGQFHHENKAPDNVVYGCYGYESPDMKNHMTFYISDSWGYRPVRQEMDTEIFYPADNPGGGHQKGTMTRWADLIFPEMCAHFAERIASSTNVVTKTPIQLAPFAGTDFETTTSPNTPQPLTGAPSRLSTRFGSKPPPVPASSFDVLHLNTPTTSGPLASSPFGRFTSTNSEVSRMPLTGASNSFNVNLPTEQEQPNTFNHIIPNRFSTGGAGTSSNVPGLTVGGSTPTGMGFGFRATTLPTTLSETEGSNVGPLSPSTSGNGSPHANARPSSSSGHDTEPFPAMADSVDTALLPETATSPPSHNERVVGTSRLPLSQGPLPSDFSQSPDTGMHFGDRTEPQEQSMHNFGQTNPGRRTTTNGRMPSRGSPLAATTFRFRSTTVGPLTETTTSRLPVSNGEGSNSGLINPTTQAPNGGSNDDEGSDIRRSQGPIRVTLGSSIGNVNNSPNPYGSSDDENDNTVGTPSGNRTPTRYVTGSRRPVGPSTAGVPEGETPSFGSSTTGGLSNGNGETGNPTGIPSSTMAPSNNRGTTESVSAITEPPQGFSSPNESAPASSPLTNERSNPPDANRRYTGRRPTTTPPPSRFPTAGFSGKFNNPSSLQPSSTNQENVPTGENSGNSPSRTTTAGQRPTSRIPIEPQTEQPFTYIPQEPEIDNVHPDVPYQPEEIIPASMVSNNPDHFSSNPGTTPPPSTDNEEGVTPDPYSGRPSDGPTSFGSRTTFSPTRSPTFSPRVPTESNGFLQRPQAGNGLRNDSTGNPPNHDDNALFCASECSSCRSEKKDSATPPPPPKDEDFLNIPGSILSQIPVIFYPDCSGNAYMRPAIVPFCPSSQPTPSQCNNGRQQPLTMRFPDANNFIVGHQNAPVARNAFASERKESSPRLARKVRRGGGPRRILRL